MKRAFLLAIFSISILPICASAEPNLKVGIITPLTGGVAVWGKSVRSAIEIANSESDSPAELFFEDEETCSPTKALTAYQVLRSVRKVDVIIASCLEGAQAIAPIARKQKVPMVISGRSSHDFQSKNPNALSWLSLLDYEGAAVAKLIKDNGWKRGTSMVWMGYFGVQFAEGIKNAIAADKLDFTLDTIEVDQGSIPSGGDVQRLLRNKPEVVFLMMSEPGAAFVVKELKALHYTGKIVLQSSMLQTYDPGVRAAFAGALQQKFPADPALFVKLQSEIKKKQGEEVADDFVFSYDGFKVVLAEANACKKSAPDTMEECLTSKLRNESWHEGASGKFKFMKDGSTERPMVFKTITANGFE